MTYEVLDTETGDVLASYSSFKVAQQRLTRHLDAHPEEIDELVIAEVEDDGAVRQMTPAEVALS